MIKAAVKLKRQPSIVNDGVLESSWKQVAVPRMYDNQELSQYSVYLARAWRSYGVQDYGGESKKFQGAYYRVVAGSNGINTGNKTLAAVIGIEHRN